MKYGIVGSLFLASVILASALLAGDSTVVFNEIMYHPETPELEWLELHNQMAVDMDISNWMLSDGVSFTFPEGTIVPGGGFVVVAASPSALEAASEFAGALGPFVGRLDNAGERLELRNNSFRVMDVVRYRDRGRWPVAPDGSGATLVKLDPDSASEPAENWGVSTQVGGSPGEHNFPSVLPSRFPAELAGFWRLNEADGAVLDPAGGNRGRLGLGATRVTGVAVGGAVSFDNTSNAFIDVGRGMDRDFSTSSGLTLEALIVPTWSGQPNDGDQIFRKEDSDNRIAFGFQHDEETDNRDVDIGAGPQPVLSFGINVGGVYSELDMPLDGEEGRPTLAALEDGTVHHVAASYDAATGRKTIYVDGVATFSAMLGAGSTITSGGRVIAYIGNMLGRSQPFTGVIDEVAFWKRALGDDEIAAHVENARAGRDYLFVEQAPEKSVAVLRINETFVSPEETWVEIVNDGRAAADLEGHVLSRGGVDNAEYAFSAGTLAPGAYLVRTTAEIGFSLALGDRLFLYSPGRAEVLDAVGLEDLSEGRHPDATGPWLAFETPTPGETNRLMLHDEIVINEIFYHARVLDTSDGIPADEPVRESPEAWLELFNRTDTAVDLTGWKLDGGIQYTFEGGTVLGPGEYLIVTNDVAFLEQIYPDLRIVGNFEGQLSHRDDIVRFEDALANPADEVHYFDRKPWPPFADGGGSSLELRDPRADNSKAEAWAASREDTKTEWTEFRYRTDGRSHPGPSQWNEFVVGLLDAGEVLIDDLSVVVDPDGQAVDLLQNGDFEAGGASWRFLGNHAHSAVIRDAENPENQVLHIVATGPTEDSHNHLETTLVDNLQPQSTEHEISFRARWLRGSNLLNTRRYFNRAARTTLLPRPARNGTPGAPNSTLEPNIGPTFSGLRHAPPVPFSDQAVTVSVVAEDPDGVSGVMLWWSVNEASRRSTEMEARERGVFVASIPQQSGGDVVHFYVEARDGLGAVSTFPRGGGGSRALYMVEDDRQARLARLHNIRIVMTPSDNDLLYLETNLMSNDHIPCTVVYDEREVFYDVGVRMRGSQRGRPAPARMGFNVTFHGDHLFRGVHNSIGLDRSGDGAGFGQIEILVKHIAQHAGGVPGMYDDLAFLIAPRRAQTSTTLLLMARYGREFLDSQYENGGEGSRHNYDLVYYSRTTTDGDPESLKRPLPDGIHGVDLRNLGDDKEAYRHHFSLENNEDRDDFRGMIAVCKALSLPVAQLEVAAGEVIDLDQWMRAYALISLCAIGDVYTFSANAHNMQFYVRPEDGRVLLLPWDMDFSFRSTTRGLLGNTGNLTRLFQLPSVLRSLYAHVFDITETTFNAEYMEYWVEHYGDLVNQDFSDVKAFVRERKEFTLRRLPVFKEFAITTNDGMDFEVHEESVILAGTAWIDVRTLILAERVEVPAVVWTSTTQWTATVGLDPGSNRLTFLAFDADGNLIGSAAITVTRPAGGVFVRGDADLSGSLNVTDALHVLRHLVGEERLPCPDAADVDNNEMLDLSDALFLLNALFRRGPPPPQPFPLPGTDPDGEGPLGCSAGPPP